MTNLYYTPPTDEAFNDMKQAAMSVWSEVSTHPDYFEEKTSRIKDIGNVGDNFMYIFAMFDDYNQRLCANRLQPETKEAVRERMIAGGNDPWLIRKILG